MVEQSSTAARPLLQTLTRRSRRHPQEERAQHRKKKKTKGGEEGIHTAAAAPLLLHMQYTFHYDGNRVDPKTRMVKSWEELRCEFAEITITVARESLTEL